jgi:RND family efflux transporter MFP subunit
VSIAVVSTGLLVAACRDDADKAEAPATPRPVRTTTVEAVPPRRGTSFPGRIEAKDSVALAFRIGGRLAERRVAVGDQVKDGQVVAMLEPQDELNALRSARAALTAAQGVLVQAENAYGRQRHLLDRGATTQANFEAVEQSRKAARAQVEAAEAQLRTAEDVVGFTVLEADAPGVVTSVGAEPGEVVGAGQPIVSLARRDGRDAVFDLPAAQLPDLSSDPRVTVRLSDDPAATIKGRVREVAPQADPVTRTIAVRVGLIDPPASFRLGAPVTVTLESQASPLVEIPASALLRRGEKEVVWLVDTKSLTVGTRPVEVLRRDAATAWIGSGIGAGDVVVTAGAGSLKDGQKIRLAGTEL